MTRKAKPPTSAEIEIDHRADHLVVSVIFDEGIQQKRAVYLMPHSAFKRGKLEFDWHPGGDVVNPPMSTRTRRKYYRMLRTAALDWWKNQP